MRIKPVSILRESAGLTVPSAPIAEFVTTRYTVPTEKATERAFANADTARSNLATHEAVKKMTFQAAEAIIANLSQ